MTEERFKEILIEQGYEKELVEAIWEGRPDDWEELVADEEEWREGSMEWLMEERAKEAGVELVEPADG